MGHSYDADPAAWKTGHKGDPNGNGLNVPGVRGRMALRLRHLKHLQKIHFLKKIESERGFAEPKTF